MRHATMLVVLAFGLAACGADADPAAYGTGAATSSLMVEEPGPTTTDAGVTSPSPASGDPAGDLPDLGPVHPLEDLDGWLQSDVTSLRDLRGMVVVVHFWTFGCHNCKATLPNLRSLYAEHGEEDFEIVGIHSPEFEYEEDPEAIVAAAEDLGVTWPIALDTRKHNFFSWQGSPAYWPRTYVLDRDGNVRFDHIGEGAYEELNHTVAALLG